MAAHTISHTCGHTSVAQLYGKMDARPREAARLGERLCLTCYKAQQQVSSVQAARANANAGDVPALSGSEKQIAWAETIRAAAIAATSTLLRETEARTGTPPPAEVTAAYERLTRQSAATWWIDRRGVAPMLLLRECH